MDKKFVEITLKLLRLSKLNIDDIADFIRDDIEIDEKRFKFEKVNDYLFLENNECTIYWHANKHYIDYIHTLSIDQASFIDDIIQNLLKNYFRKNMERVLWYVNNERILYSQLIELLLRSDVLSHIIDKYDEIMNQ